MHGLQPQRTEAIVIILLTPQGGTVTLVLAVVMADCLLERVPQFVPQRERRKDFHAVRMQRGKAQGVFFGCAHRDTIVLVRFRTRAESFKQAVECIIFHAHRDANGRARRHGGVRCKVALDVDQLIGDGSTVLPRQVGALRRSEQIQRKMIELPVVCAEQIIAPVVADQFIRVDKNRLGGDGMHPFIARKCIADERDALLALNGFAENLNGAEQIGGGRVARRHDFLRTRGAVAEAAQFAGKFAGKLFRNIF